MAVRVGDTAGGGAGERRGAGMAARGGAQVRGTRGRRVSLGRRSAKAASARRRIVRRSSRSAPSWVGQARRQTRQRPTGRRGVITGQEVTRVGRRKQHRLLPSGASRVTVPPIPAAQPSSTWRMDAVPGPLPLEELQLTRSPLAHRLHPREAELLDHALDRGLRDTEPVHAPEPELCPRGAVAEVEARMPDEVGSPRPHLIYYACRPLPPRRTGGHRPPGAIRPVERRGAPAPGSRRKRGCGPSVSSGSLHRRWPAPGSSGGGRSRSAASLTRSSGRSRGARLAGPRSWRHRRWMHGSPSTSGKCVRTRSAHRSTRDHLLRAGVCRGHAAGRDRRLLQAARACLAQASSAWSSPRGRNGSGWERASAGYRPFHTGLRFSANARGPRSPTPGSEARADA